MVLPLFKTPQFLTDACIASESKGIFDVFEAEQDKGALEIVFMGDVVTFSSSHLLQSVDIPIWKDAFKEDKLSFLIVDFRSLPEKPRRHKQDFTVVEQYPLAPTSIAKRWTDQPLDFIEVLSGSYFWNFFRYQTSIFSSQDKWVL